MSSVITGTVQFEVVARHGGRITGNMVLVGREPALWAFPDRVPDCRAIFSQPADAVEFLEARGFDPDEFEVRPATNRPGG